MDFFEVLAGRAEARKARQIFHGYEHDTWASGKGFGINATIEALKEMMVGEPCPMHLEYFRDGMLLRDLNGEVHGSYPFRFGCADGEEVAVIVFRLS